MDITNFVVQGRDKALLYGDYSTYHAQLSQRLLNCRKKLGIATKNRGKFQKKEPADAEAIGQNHEHVHILLLTSERAWAQAMSIKAAHSSDQKGIIGRRRSHIVSRLQKSSRTAHHLVKTIEQTGSSGATTNDILEAKAYESLITGAMYFEKQSWEACLHSYAVTRIIYSALSSSTQSDVFKDLLSETIDPSIRYAAYQLKTPRTVPIPVIAKKSFPRSDDALVRDINKLDPTILSKVDPESQAAASEAAPKTLTWRTREVQIEDAQIADAWNSVAIAKTRLAEKFSGSDSSDSYGLAAAYDEILTATQDAVDATKEAIDEMRAEGVNQSDQRMQRLQITRTAVNYEMISWRIGRNRVLTGTQDGATEEYAPTRRTKKFKSTDAAKAQQQELPPSRKLAKLKEKVALYNGTLQSLESVKELPGVAADEELAARIDSYEKYFSALKCLAIARSHAIVGNVANALGLIQRSSELCHESTSKGPQPADVPDSLALNIDVAPSSRDILEKLLNGELQRHRAIVHIDNLRNADKGQAAPKTKLPLVERLHEYPSAGVDLGNIVEFPPKMALIPVKPIFLDVAWNYIDYPGRASDSGAPSKTGASASASEPTQEQPQQAKRGWFGFGRS